MRWKIQPSPTLDAQSSELKTIREWEQEYQILILDVDGFDISDSQLYNRLFSRREFEQAVAQCTILRKEPVSANRPIKPSIGPEPSPPPSRKQRRATSSLRENRPKPEKKVKLNRATVWFLLACTLPTLATMVIYWAYQQINRRFKIPWYVPITLLVTDGLVGLIQPISPFISGPGYLWYLVLNGLVQISHSLITYVRENLLHAPQVLTLGDPAMFLGNTTLSGNAVPLYFTFGSALASSIYLATLITFCADIGRRAYLAIPGRRQT